MALNGRCYPFLPPTPLFEDCKAPRSGELCADIDIWANASSKCLETGMIRVEDMTGRHARVVLFLAVYSAVMDRPLLCSVSGLFVLSTESRLRLSFLTAFCGGISAPDVVGEEEITDERTSDQGAGQKSLRKCDLPEAAPSSKPLSRQYLSLKTYSPRAGAVALGIWEPKTFLQTRSCKYRRVIGLEGVAERKHRSGAQNRRIMAKREWNRSHSD